MPVRHRASDASRKKRETPAIKKKKGQGETVLPGRAEERPPSRGRQEFESRVPSKRGAARRSREEQEEIFPKIFTIFQLPHSEGLLLNLSYLAEPNDVKGMQRTWIPTERSVWMFTSPSTVTLTFPRRVWSVFDILAGTDDASWEMCLNNQVDSLSLCYN
ncbi:hypothetical protein GWK47_009549 [Chionoecetes opilio]|uniref:Uncharacterized protein n=1 Tax=Chionoecetes opilio TaxID=41210 RepID=A0A8J4XWW2_CHIOP|nr:hypothetical protein GWK47_009549 [Chionoecetes opilio]